MQLLKVTHKPCLVGLPSARVTSLTFLPSYATSVFSCLPLHCPTCLWLPPILPGDLPPGLYHNYSLCHISHTFTGSVDWDVPVCHTLTGHLHKARGSLLGAPWVTAVTPKWTQLQEGRSGSGQCLLSTWRGAEHPLASPWPHDVLRTFICSQSLQIGHVSITSSQVALVEAKSVDVSIRNASGIFKGTLNYGYTSGWG